MALPHHLHPKSSEAVAAVQHDDLRWFARHRRAKVRFRPQPQASRETALAAAGNKPEAPQMDRFAAVKLERNLSDRFAGKCMRLPFLLIPGREDQISPAPYLCHSALEQHGAMQRVEVEGIEFMGLRQ